MKMHEYRDCNERGRIVRISYEARDHKGIPVTKEANIYLPREYDENPEKRYNILYLMHGGGGSEDAFLDSTPVKNMLDTAFEEKKTEPFIVVFPTYYKHGAKEGRGDHIPRDWENVQVSGFQKELAEDLIPAVESRVRSFADTIDQKGLQASRKHRAFGGFSMGGATTWYAFASNLSLIANFLPLSGDCWALDIMGGKTMTEETAAFLAACPAKQGYGPDDFRIYAATGTEDIAHAALTPMIEAMKKQTESFTFDEDLTKGNLHYYLETGAWHSYQAVYQYLYYYLPVLFSI